METTTREPRGAREAREALLVVERARTTAARHSLNNGALLLVWGDTFLLDMVAFDAGRLVGTVWPAVAFVVIFTSSVVLWKVWYERHMPVRPLTVQFDRSSSGGRGAMPSSGALALARGRSSSGASRRCGSRLSGLRGRCRSTSWAYASGGWPAPTCPCLEA